MMTRRQLLSVLAAASGNAALKAQRSSESLGAAYDLLYQALELLSASSTSGDVGRAVRFLRGALDQYPSFGDAHYYRALCLKRLNQDSALQMSDMQAADRYQSEARRDRRDPFTLAVPKLEEQLAQVGQKWALVVGLSQFQPETGAEPLRFAADDAASFADMLRDPSVGRFPANQVFLLTNEHATTAAVKARLNTIATRAKPEDVVVVYVSTHGSSRSDDLRGVSYLYTYDTNVTSRDFVFGSALAMVELSGIISTRCLAQRTVVILDTCHSGAGTAPSQSLSASDLDRLRAGAGRYILTSCQDGQLSYEDNGHGLFTASLLNQLRAKHGCVPMMALYSAVKTEVSNKAAAAYKRQQSPVLAASENAAPVVLGAAVGSPGTCPVA